jgi:hypothetical protein
MTLASRRTFAAVLAIALVVIYALTWSRRGENRQQQLQPPPHDPIPIATAPTPTPPAITPSNPISKTPLTPPPATDDPEAELVNKIALQKEALAALEAETYAKDPHLQVYEKFRDDPERWFGTNFAGGEKPLWEYQRPADPVEAKKRQKACQDLGILFGMSNFKELADVPQYTHLLTVSSEVLGRLQTSPKITYTGDRLIGWKEPIQENRTGEQVLADFAKRYELVTQKINELVQENQIPEDVVAYIKGRSIAASLMAAADIYTQTRTPPELTKMRGDLKRLELQLRNLQH